MEIHEEIVERYVSPRLAEGAQERAMLALYGDPAFQNAVKLLKRMFKGQSLKNPDIKAVFLSRLRMVLSRWGLHLFPHPVHQNYRWLAWLVSKWNPDKVLRPRIPRTIEEPILGHWFITYLVHPFNFSPDTTFHKAHRNAWVNVTFFPGTTKAQAKKAVAAAIDLANAPMRGKARQKSKGGRPGFSEAERRSMITLFEAVGFPENTSGKRQADKLREMAELIATGLQGPEFALTKDRPVSLSALKNEYRKWMLGKGMPARQYVTAKKDARVQVASMPTVQI